MNNLFHHISEQCPEFLSLCAAIKQQEQNYWLVGGCLRDFNLQRPFNDIDLATPGDPTTLVQRWARQVDGHWFWLDRERRYSRVVLPSRWQCDFAPLRAETLRADLALRDFTINAMAVALGNPVELIDPFDGRLHLRQKRLQPVGQRSYRDDPLRMLKGIRHAVILNFDISEEEVRAIRGHCHLIDDVAGERIREELWAILRQQNPYALDLLIDSGLLAQLFEIDPDQFEQNRVALKRRLLQQQQKNMRLERFWLQFKSSREPFEAVSVVYSLASILYEAPGDIIVDALQKRLRLSRFEVGLLKRLMDLHLNSDKLIAYLSKAYSQRTRALVVEPFHPHCLATLLYLNILQEDFCLSDVSVLYSAFLAVERHGRVAPLIDGGSVATLLNKNHNGTVSDWLNKLKEAEINREILTKPEAEIWLKNKLNI